MSDRSDVEQVRERSDILQVIAPYVALKRVGKVWKGLCPFHNEKTPSFHVNAELGRWHCFGQCAEGGDVFKFLQKVENLTFPEALERLALKAGVTLETRERGSGKAAPPTGERDRLYHAVETAARYYEQTLTRATAAQEYLQTRALAHETQRAFRVGCSGEEWEGLTRFLEQNAVAAEDAVTAGLIVASERGGYFDKLRGRIVFPILDVQERPIAFGGRLMEDVPGRPKYLNSAETPLFSKGKTLYGLWRARKAIADAEEAIVVEGYLDVMTCHQAGFENVVATLGTALTEDHAQILGRHARRALLAFDADAAGLKAAHRANALFEAQEIEVRILDMPDGEDPDSLLRANRSAEFRRSIQDAVPVAEFQLRRLLRQANPSAMSERDKSTFFQRELLPILRGTKSVLERERYIRMCAPLHPYYSSGTAYAEEQIREEIEGRHQAPPPAFRGGHGDGRNRWGDRPGRYPAPPSAPPALQVNSLRTSEETLLKVLLLADEERDSEAARFVEANVTPELFATPVYARLAQHLLESQDRRSALETIDGDEALGGNPAVAALLVGENGLDPLISLQSVQDMVRRLREREEKRHRAELLARALLGDKEAEREHTRLYQERDGIVPIPA